MECKTCPEKREGKEWTSEEQVNIDLNAREWEIQNHRGMCLDANQSGDFERGLKRQMTRGVL